LCTLETRDLQEDAARAIQAVSIRILRQLLFVIVLGQKASRRNACSNGSFKERQFGGLNFHFWPTGDGAPPVPACECARSGVATTFSVRLRFRWFLRETRAHISWPVRQDGHVGTKRNAYL